MEKSQYNLCVEVLRRFHKAGVLGALILIGSWTSIFYRVHFKNFARLNQFVLMTRDIDFLIDMPGRIKQRVDIPKLLEDLGFIVSFSGSQGYIKLDHPELIVEFLTPERGRGVDRPVPLSTLGINATALRFLGFLSEDTIKVKVEDFFVTLPHPVRFAFHKLIIAQRRKNKDKAVKDTMLAFDILNDMIDAGQSEILCVVFDGMTPSWRKKVLDGIPQGQERVRFTLKNAANK